MRGLRFIIFAAALLFGGAAFASDDPCELAARDDVERVLRGVIVPVPVDQIGEETAPYCLWATAGRKAEIKLSIWSREELPVLDFADAESYFTRLEAEAQSELGFGFVDGFGVRAFQGASAIVMLKNERVIVLDYEGVEAEHARWLAGRIAEGL